MISKLGLILISITLACGTLPAATIDQLLSEQHQSADIQPTSLCDDATFARRLSLDLIGRVPTTEELAAFLRNPNREQAIERHLSSKEHATFWSELWTTMLIGRGQQRSVQRELLRRWLQDKLTDQTGINQVVFELISAEGVTSLHGPVNFAVSSREDPVMRISRTFLAVQLDRAQCHDHPHDRWTNDDYVSMQRFFQRVRYREISGGIAVDDASTDTGGERPVFLTGRQPHTEAWRRELALMVVQSKPFSRAMVNRTWSWLLGRGIVEPVDGLSRENQPSVPELLEALASDFRDQGFQLQPLIRQICRSDAYQRDSLAGAAAQTQRQRELFAARTVRLMTPEQWIASLAVVLDRPLPDPATLADKSRQLLGLPRQSLANDPYEWTATSQTVVRQLSSPMPTPLQDLDALYLATVARRPTSDERALVDGYTSRETLFALVHGNEFLMND